MYTDAFSLNKLIKHVMTWNWASSTSKSTLHRICTSFIPLFLFFFQHIWSPCVSSVRMNLDGNLQSTHACRLSPTNSAYTHCLTNMVNPLRCLSLMELNEQSSFKHLHRLSEIRLSTHTTTAPVLVWHAVNTFFIHIHSLRGTHLQIANHSVLVKQSLKLWHLQYSCLTVRVWSQF